MFEILNTLINAGSSVLVGLITFLGVVITNSRYNKSIEHKLETAQAVTETKIEELTREVREQANFARRLPVVENNIETIYHRLNAVEHTKN